MSEKNEAFHRLAVKRVETLTDQIRIFSNLSGPSYEWTAAEVMAYFDQIFTALGEAQKRFMEQKNWNGAKLADDDLPEFPVIGSVWEHTNGNLYRVEEITNQETARQDQYPTSVSYRNIKNGKPYSRKLIDWHRSMTLVGTDEPEEGPESPDETVDAPPAETEEHPSIAREKKRARSITQLLKDAESDNTLLPNLLVLQKEVIDNLQGQLDELRGR
jgi:hypothetical protein